MIDFRSFKLHLPVMESRTSICPDILHGALFRMILLKFISLIHDKQ